MKPYFLFFFLIPLFTLGQKKPLDHSVYDDWQHIGEKVLSDDGNWIFYTILPQEGDGTLIVQSTSNTNDKQQIARGYHAQFTPDSQHLIFKIKPQYQKTRQAKIKKKAKDDMPKDSLGILNLSTGNLVTIERIASYQIPKEESAWISFKAYPHKAAPANKTVEKLENRIDSLKNVIQQLKGETGSPEKEETQISQKDKTLPKGGELVLYNLQNNQQISFSQVGDYKIADKGTRAAFVNYHLSADSIRNSAVLLVDLSQQRTDTLLKNINQAKNFAFNKEADQLAFIAESGDASKVKPQIFDLYLYNETEDNTAQIANSSHQGIPEGYGISEFGKIDFSENGQKLFFGTAPIPADKDTSLVDIDLVKVDIWNYKDDYLQPYQLKNLKRERERNYLAYYNLQTKKIHQLGTEGLPRIQVMDEGNSRYAIGITDTNRRIASQWAGKTLKDIYLLDTEKESALLVQKNFDGYVYPSPKGHYILFYDNKHKAYFTYDNTAQTYQNITEQIDVPLYDELNDIPTDPRPYGVMGWLADDEALFLYDRYDIWRVDPKGKKSPKLMTPNARASQVSYRYRQTDPEQRFLHTDQLLIFQLFNDQTKAAELAETKLGKHFKFKSISRGDVAFSPRIGASKDGKELLYTKESYIKSPDLYLYKSGKEEKLSALNPQQEQYNWGTAELFNWTTYSGKQSTGVLYKPENFDPEKKYPVILYFYERRSNSLHEYIPPEPTRSRLNISLFVSQGYLVFEPDIAYDIGHPGPSAYDYIVSGAEALAKEKWVDAKNMGIQGQSWGGYQVAYLITQTDLFKAAWAGAPVVNMFSAYGGIRWGTGLNRQFQYEKTQSRIGATIWEKPELYVENSPLFELPKVHTPVVIMHNDQDGAVPWYQGIEMFTALRRLGKPVWFLNYNGEDHNLIQRKNKKDIQIRELQFFDYLLKGKKPAKWISEGVPATKKGMDWGLEVN